MIRLQTSQGRDIPNEQRPEFDLATGQIEEARIRLNYASVEIRPGSSGIYNCHGLTFAARRTRIPEAASISMILADDKYREVARADLLPGDVVTYTNDAGDVVHSGIVLEKGGTSATLRILSKWGYGPEVIHDVNTVPPVYRNSKLVFLRCGL